MTRYLCIPKMLRLTPNDLLQAFFDKLGHKLLCLNWRKLKQRQSQAILSSLELLPEEAKHEVQDALGTVHELCSAAGVRALFEACRQFGRPELIEQMPRRRCYYALAMWTWLNAPDIFEQASRYAQVDELTRWRKRRGLPKVTPSCTKTSTHELGLALARVLRREEGRGDQCSVEYFRREDGADYFAAYPDDFTRTLTKHNRRGKLVPQIVRPTFEIVFAYRQEEGALDLYAQVSPHVKPHLEAVFAQIILRADLSPDTGNLPFDLNRLKDRYFCLDTDPADQVTAAIQSLRLDVPRLGRFTVEPFQKGHVREVHDLLDECLDSRNVPWREVHISMARIQFSFEAVGKRRGGLLTLDITYPDHCAIRSRSSQQIEITRKYLRRWRIARV